MLIYFQMIIALALGLIASFSDFKNKKIYNKNIVIAMIISTILYSIFYKQIDAIFIKNYIINLLITVVIAFAFFYLKIWAAGDAKLFIAITYMIPFEVYELNENNYFASLYLLIIIFSLAFVYVFFETLYLFLKDKEKNKIFKMQKIEKSKVIDGCISYLMGCFIISFLNNVMYKLFFDFCCSNSELIYISNILILFFIYRITNTKKRVILLKIFLILNMIYYICFGFKTTTIDLSMYIIILLIIIYKNISEKYNYKIINIQDLKDRMILSFESVLAFYGSRVKGLPTTTDETTDSRLTKEQVNSIKRWSKTKNGSETITIVRHMPFAPFMFLGELLFFIYKVII